MKYDVTRSIKGKIETSQGLSHTGVIAWIGDTLTKPDMQWFMVYEAEFNRVISTPKSWSTK